MTTFGLLLTLISIPGWTSASIPGQWAFLSATLPFALWRRGDFGLGHKLGLSALAWATLSSLWALSKWDAAHGLWIMFIWAGSFWLGTVVWDLTRVFKGLALGLTVSSALAIAQYFGFNLILTTSWLTPDLEPIPSAAGLFFNPTVLGAASALVFVTLFHTRRWFYCLGLLPALALCHSRGAWLALAVGIAVRRVPWPIIGIALLAAMIYLVLGLSQSDSQRLFIWGLAIAKSSLWGNGIGSFNSLYYLNHDLLFHQPFQLVHVEFSHNDYLQLWFELGLGSILILAIFAIAVWQTGLTTFPPLITFATLMLYYFPLYHPLTAFIGCYLAGRAVTIGHQSWAAGYWWRPDFFLWHPAPTARFSLLWRHAVPTRSQPSD